MQHKFQHNAHGLKLLTWNWSEDIRDKNADDRLVEDVIRLTHVLLDSRHSTQRMQLVCWKLLLSITV